MIFRLLLSLFIIFLSTFVKGQGKEFEKLREQIDRQAIMLEKDAIAWRHDIHQHPELGNQEVRTAKLVAAHLESLGMEVQTGVAVTGVVGVLKGSRPGPVVALRADMDALPVTEQTGLPFASMVRTEFNGQETGVMHACGHDMHTSILMGVAAILASMRDELPGTVKFIFQPAEESLNNMDTWGARQMIDEGVLEGPRPDVIFGLHTWVRETGVLAYRSGAFMASVDNFRIVVKGRGTHGAMPWDGRDPIVAASQIVVALQTLVSRNVNLTEGAAVVTVGSIHGGNRNNIIPDEVEMLGTIRTHNETARNLIHKRLTELVKTVAESAGTEAAVEITRLYPTTVNDPDITARSLPYLELAAGEKNVEEIFPVMPAEDFSYYLEEIPGMYFFLGVVEPGTPADKVEPNHSPRFRADDQAMITGMKALAYLTIGYMTEQ